MADAFPATFMGPPPDPRHGLAVTAKAIEAIGSRFPGAVIERVSFRDEETLYVEPSRLVEIGRFLKDDPDLAFASLVDITAIHYLDRPYEFEVAWLLCSMRNNALLRLKVRVGGDPGAGSVPTVTGVWPTADWHEREEWDKVGVVFEGHPNLTRILLPEDWEGHPLRKDYPMEGIGA